MIKLKVGDYIYLKGLKSVLCLNKDHVKNSPNLDEKYERIATDDEIVEYKKYMGN